MKKIISFLLCGSMVFGAVSCSNDYGVFDQNTQSENLVDLSFFSKDGHSITRTALATDGSSVIWNANDVIGIGYQGTPGNKTKPFKTSKNGNVARFYGKAEDNKSAYFAIYPYQETGKIEYISPTKAKFEYTLSNTQKAIAKTFDPQANPSVALIPKPEESFTAYNLGGLLKFKIKGSSNVKQVTLNSINQEPLSGSFKSEVEFNNNKAISTLKNTVASGSPVLTYKPEVGSFAEATDYYVALPVTTLQKGLTLAFILENGKVVQAKVRSEIAIKRDEIKDLGEITVDESKAKDHILKNTALIDAIAERVPDLVRDADGKVNIYNADNFEKILSYKGELKIENQDKLTSIDELQYYRNVTEVKLLNNKNLAGKLDFKKSPQLVKVTVENSPLVTSIDITGLEKITRLYTNNLNKMTEAFIKDNKNLEYIELHHNNVLEKVDVRDLPELKTLKVNSNPQVTAIHTEGSPKLDLLNAMNDAGVTSMPGLKDNPLLAEFYADNIKLESIDFSHNPRLRKIQINNSKTLKNIIGLNASGANLLELRLHSTSITGLDISNNTSLVQLMLKNSKIASLNVSNNTKLKELFLERTPIASLDVSRNTELEKLYTEKTQLTQLDIRANTKLKELKSSLCPITTFVLGDNTALTYLDISSCKLSTIDITKLTALKEVYAGAQGNSSGRDQLMTIHYTANQQATLDGKINSSKNKPAGPQSNRNTDYVVKN